MSDELTLDVLERLADEAGLDAVGVTSAAPFDNLRTHLETIRRRGLESGFEHRDIEARVHPERLTQDAQSVIAVAIAYRTPATEQLKRPGGARGFVSKYAWGMDYHHVLREKMHALAAAIERHLGRTLSYDTSVDTGPLVDRAVAARAGIGWFGKNCSIITDSHGSWVFLGQIVCDVRIERSEPAPWSLCGDCDLCIKACPTGALDEPYVTDAPKCLSFITQMKGSIPEAFRAPMGRRVWGCDTCQVVCPKNKGVRLGSDSSFDPDPELAYPDLIRVLSMSGRAFLKEFGHTAIAWRGARTVKRNALIALGNMRWKSALPVLIDYLNDPHPVLRGSAAWALCRIGGEEARRAVRAALDMEEDAEARQEMEWALHDDARAEGES